MNIFGIKKENVWWMNLAKKSKRDLIFLQKSSQDSLMKCLKWQKARNNWWEKPKTVCVQTKVHSSNVDNSNCKKLFPVFLCISQSKYWDSVLSIQVATNLVYFLWSIYIDSDQSISCTYIRCRHRRNLSQSYGDDLFACFYSTLSIFYFRPQYFSYWSHNHIKGPFKRCVKNCICVTKLV